MVYSRKVQDNEDVIKGWKNKGIKQDKTKGERNEEKCVTN